MDILILWNLIRNIGNLCKAKHFTFKLILIRQLIVILYRFELFLINIFF